MYDKKVESILAVIDAMRDELLDLEKEETLKGLSCASQMLIDTLTYQQTKQTKIPKLPHENMSLDERIKLFKDFIYNNVEEGRNYGVTSTELRKTYNMICDTDETFISFIEITDQAFRGNPNISYIYRDDGKYYRGMDINIDKYNSQ